MIPILLQSSSAVTAKGNVMKGCGGTHGIQEIWNKSVPCPAAAKGNETLSFLCLCNTLTRERKFYGLNLVHGLTESSERNRREYLALSP